MHYYQHRTTHAPCLTNKHQSVANLSHVDPIDSQSAAIKHDCTQLKASNWKGGSISVCGAGPIHSNNPRWAQTKDGLGVAEVVVVEGVGGSSIGVGWGRDIRTVKKNDYRNWAIRDRHGDLIGYME